MTPPGRPPLDPTRAASARLAFRLTPREYDQIYRCAKDARQTLTEYVRTAVQDRIKHETPPGRED